MQDAGLPSPNSFAPTRSGLVQKTHRPYLLPLDERG